MTSPQQDVFSQFELLEEIDPFSEFQEVKKRKPRPEPEPEPEPQTTIPGLAGAATRGVSSGILGAFGAIQDLLGIAGTEVANLVTGQDQDYSDIREEIRTQGTPGQQARSRAEFDALERLEDPNASFMDRFAALSALESDYILPEATVLPNPGEVEKFVDIVTANSLKPTTATERVVGSAAEGIGVGLPLGFASLPAIISGAAAGGAGQALEEVGVGPTGQIVGSLVAGLAAPSVSRLGSGLAREAGAVATGSQGVREGAARSAARVFQETPSAVTPGQLNSQIIKEAAREGIPLPPGAISNNRTLRFLQSVVDESAATGVAPELAAQRTSEAFVKSFKDSLSNISENAVPTKIELGQGLQDSLLGARQGARQSTSNLYDFAETLLPPEANVSTKPIVQKGEQILKNFGRFRSPEERAAASNIEEIIKSFKDSSGKAIEVSASEIQKLKRSLNNLIDFETVGGPKQLLKTLQRTTTEVLEDVGRQNPQWFEAFKRAETSHASNAEIFGNKRIAQAIRSERPEALLNIANDVSGVRAIKSALDKLPNGEEAFNQFRRGKIEELLINKVVEPVSGKAKFGGARSALADPKKRDLFRELLGEEQFKRVQELAKIGDAISEGANKFANFSRTASRGVDVAHGFAVLHNMGQFFTTLDPSYLVSSGVVYGAPRVGANIFTDPAFTEQLVKMARASKSNNSKAYERAFQAIVPRLDEILIESDAEFVNPAKPGIPQNK